jgi:hypothetical protein
MVGVVFAGVFFNVVFAATEDPDPIISLFDTFHAKGLSGGLVFSQARKDPISIDLGGLTPTSIIPERAIYVTVKLGMFSNGEASTAAVSEIVAGLTRSCDEQGGQLDVKVIQEGYKYFQGGKPMVLVIQKAFTDLMNKKLIGGFTCFSEKGRIFFAAVEPRRTWEDTFIPPGFSWSFFVSLATRRQITDKENELSKSMDEAIQLRKSLQPGMEVAMLAAGVPPALMPKTSLAERLVMANPLMVCAMVVDVKPTLVQLQVETGTLFVPLSKVFPFKRKLNPAGALPASDWENWCIGT